MILCGFLPSPRRVLGVGHFKRAQVGHFSLAPKSGAASCSFSLISVPHLGQIIVGSDMFSIFLVSKRPDESLNVELYFVNAFACESIAFTRVRDARLRFEGDEVLAPVCLVALIASAWVCRTVTFRKFGLRVA